MEILNIPVIQGFMRMCEDGWLQGWHERNGGNLSYRMKETEVEACRPCFSAGVATLPIGAAVKELAGEYFLVTGSGRFFRNVPLRPRESFGIIRITEDGEHYEILWGLEGGKPTSELPTHLLNHQVKKRVTGGEYRVIYHAHPGNLIALTFVLPLTDEAFTRSLWEMATECPVVFPAGVGVVPWMVPGGREIGVETSKLMEEYDVAVWAHHGAFCAGPDFDLTFGLMHTVEKSAEILVKVKSMAPTLRQTITPEDFRALAPAFGVTLPEKFLYEKK